MKRLIISLISLFAFLLVIGPVSHLMAQVQDAPANVAAALIVKLAAFEKNISGGGDVTVYIMGAADVATELQKGIGQAIGNGTLKSVASGDGVPTEKPTILYVGNGVMLDAAIAYSRANDVLTMTGQPELVGKGVTLGFGVGGDGKPKIQLNLNSSVEENVSWNPAIMKVAKTVKE